MTRTLVARGDTLVVVLPEVLRSLRCPICGGVLARAAAALRCLEGHSFDIARQGYVSLLGGWAPARTETAQMVAARAELLAAGHLGAVAAAVADTAGSAAAGWSPPPGLVVDVGAGTGYYLAEVLNRLPAHHGLALDAAKPAARRAARAHVRAVAVVSDAWRRLPLADSCADLVLNIFAPRNGAEFRRILRPAGALLVVTPGPDHLAELVQALGLITVDPDKDRRLDAALGRRFRLVRSSRCDYRLRLGREDAARLVAMGPSSWHVEPERIGSLLAALPTPIGVTASVTVRQYQPLAQDPLDHDLPVAKRRRS